MKQYYIRKLLEKDKLNEISSIIKNANTNDHWIDGLITNPRATHNIKKNLQLNNLDSSKIINDYIMQSLDNDSEFLYFTSASTTNLNLISKIESGGYYNPHMDDFSCGDFSTTVFLNNPEDYGGGELCLYLGGQEEIKIKLDAGWAVTYQTGILHRVSKVSFGNRYVSIFWTKSKIKDLFMRNIYYELKIIQDCLRQQSNPIHSLDCIGASKDPLFVIGNMLNDILRKYSSH